MSAISAPPNYVRGNHDPGSERRNVSAYLPMENRSEAPSAVLGGSRCRTCGRSSEHSTTTHGEIEDRAVALSRGMPARALPGLREGRSSPTGRPVTQKGFGYVDMPPSAARAATQKRDGWALGGRNLTVRTAKPRSGADAANGDSTESKLTDDWSPVRLGTVPSKL